jgi:hypothetical protein
LASNERGVSWFDAASERVAFNWEDIVLYLPVEKLEAFGELAAATVAAFRGHVSPGIEEPLEERVPVAR